jgi:lysophospholipase L1-like esterase
VRRTLSKNPRLAVEAWKDWRTVSVVLALAAAAGCASPSAPSPGDTPRISCPASLSSETTAVPAIVTYQPPTVFGGKTPVAITCSPSSGSTFPAGATVVSCTAMDAQARTDACTFSITVTVAAPPRIGATRYVAFGDSITEGKLGPAAYHSDPRFSFPDAYAKMLYDQLAARYTAQTIEMFNEGIGGNQVHGGAPPDGVTRLPGVLTADTPDALLLLEGVNDLINGDSVANVAAGLRDMVREARRRGIVVFLATLLPQRAGGSRSGHSEQIVPANDAIRGVAAAEGAVLVDLYAAFGGSPDPWIDADGLHPTADGYRKIAETFLAEIRRRLESQKTTPFSTGLTSPTDGALFGSGRRNSSAAASGNYPD